ncbi:unnamed protein product, partial [Mesorhabditis spiculigera]
MERLQPKVYVKNELGRALLGEFVGTMILLLIGTSVVAQHELPRVRINEQIGVNIGFGLAIAFGVAVSAKLSGGHINPAVSLMFLSLPEPSLEPPSPSSSTTTPSTTLTVETTRWSAPTRRPKFSPRTRPPHLGTINGLTDQIIATAVFCFLIAHFTDERRTSYPNWVRPLLIGLSFVAIGTAFSFNCGYPCNPARDFGPRLFTLLAGYGGETFTYRGWWWVPIVGPFIGALIGAWLYQFTIGFHTSIEVLTKYAIVEGPKKSEHIKEEGEQLVQS